MALYTYSHTSNDNYEHLRYEADGDDLTPTEECIADISFNFGHVLSKIMECAEIASKYLPATDSEYGDTEYSNIFLEMEMVFQSPDDKVLWEKFLKRLFHDLPNLLFGFIRLLTIYNFVQLCSDNQKYCLNEYLIIMATKNGISVDGPSSFIRNIPIDMETVNNKKSMRELLEAYGNSEKQFVFRRHYDCYMLIGLCIAILQEIFYNNRIIKKCPNCNRYFVPLKRSDTIYCNEKSPQDPSKTCREYGIYTSYLKKTQTNEAIKLYKQIYNSKNNKMRRYNGSNDRLCNDLRSFVETAKQWKTDVKDGAKTEAEYIKWLKEVKEKKAL